MNGMNSVLHSDCREARLLGKAGLLADALGAIEGAGVFAVALFDLDGGVLDAEAVVE